jgi:hypothetical protein
MPPNLSEIQVPSASGSKVFLLIKKIFFLKTGCIGGYNTLAPNVTTLFLIGNESRDRFCLFYNFLSWCKHSVNIKSKFPPLASIAPAEIAV